MLGEGLLDEDRDRKVCSHHDRLLGDLQLKPPHNLHKREGRLQDRSCNATGRVSDTNLREVIDVGLGADLLVVGRLFQGLVEEGPREWHTVSAACQDRPVDQAEARASTLMLYQPWGGVDLHGDIEIWGRVAFLNSGRNESGQVYRVKELFKVPKVSGTTLAQ